MNFLKIKEALEAFYGRYSGVCRFFGKMLLGFLIFFTIRRETGYLDKLNNPLLLTGLSVLCGILPVNLCVLLASVVVLLHFYSLSYCALAVGGAILLILLLLYFGVASDHGYAFLLTPVALGLNVPMAVPLVVGLTSHSSSMFGMLFGAVWYYVMRTVADRAEALRQAQATVERAADIERLIGEAAVLLEKILKRRELILTLVVFLAVWLVAWTGRRMVMKYAWTMAIGAGTVVYLVLMIVGMGTLELSVNWPAFLVGTAAAVLIALVVQVFLFLPDYRRTESVQFEDDDYYYYVKAIPKKRSGESPASPREETEVLTREERRRQRRENMRTETEPESPRERT
ncbi:MAG: hypothetical protein Q4F41_18275 [Eubacteriales bacterium]|nr:hypothetical protein [Eubacteriales bacterium]